MVATEELTDVIFRVDREGEVFALMPGLAGTRDVMTCTAYQHVGQHCSADLQGCIRSSRPAKAEEFAALLREMQGRGYIVNAVKHSTRNHLIQRARQL